MVVISDELAALKRENPEAFFAVVLNDVCSRDDHWWCSAPTAMQELLPRLSRKDKDIQLELGIIAKQLLTCRSCARKYHAAVDSLRDCQMSGETETAAIVTALQDWDTSRLVRVFLSAVDLWFQAIRNVGSKTLDQYVAEERRIQCESLFFELLLDARLVARGDVSAIIEKMFSKGNPVLGGDAERDFVAYRDGFCLPGMYVLCMHSSTAVRLWAQRCLRQRSPLAGLHGQLIPTSVWAALDILCRRIASVAPSSDTAASAVWDGLSYLLIHFKSSEVVRQLYAKHAVLWQIVVDNMLHNDPTVATAACTVISLSARALGSDLWLLPCSDNAQALLKKAGQVYHDNRAGITLKESVLSIVLPLLQSISGCNFETRVDIILTAVNLLLLFCELPAPGCVRNNLSFASTKDSLIGQKNPLLRKARESTAIALIQGYELAPSAIVLNVDMNLVSCLLDVLYMSYPYPGAARQLLGAVLIADAEHIMCALTSSEVFAAACSIRRSKASTESRSLGMRSDATISNCWKPSPAITPSTHGRNVRAGTFCWAEQVWVLLHRGRFRTHTLGDKSKEPWVEGEVLLEVHALLGNLDVVEDTVPLSGIDPRLRSLREDSGSHSDKDGQRLNASVLHAYLMAVEAVSRQVKRVSGLVDLSREAWLVHLPYASAHLFSSCRKDIRDLSGKLFLRALSASGQLYGAGFVPLLKSPIDLVNEPRYSSLTLEGSIDTAKFLYALGPKYSFRSYLHLIRWFERLLTHGSKEVRTLFAKRDGLLHTARLLAKFFCDWHDCFSCHMSHFREVALRVLSATEVIWPKVVDDCEDVPFNGVHDLLLSGLLAMGSCLDAAVQKRWIHVLVKVTKSSELSVRHCEVLRGILRSSPEEPAPFSLQQCEILTTHFGMDSVPYPRHADHESSNDCDDAVSEVVAVCDSLGNRSTTTRPANNNRYFVDLRATPASSVHCSHPTLVRKRPATSAGFRPKTKLTELREKTGTLHAKKLPVQPVHKGPTLMERQVEEYKRQKAEEKAKAKETSSKDADAPIEANARVQQVAEQSRVPNVIGRFPSNRFDRTQEKVICRNLRPRSIDDFHGEFLRWSVKDLLNEEQRNRIMGAPVCKSSRFAATEKYVQFWEQLLLAEFRAQVVQAMEDEEGVSKFPLEASLTAKWYCRTPFEVVGAAEPRHKYKLLNLRYCGGGNLRDSGASSARASNSGIENREDRSAADVGVADLVRVQMALHGRGHVDGGHSTTAVAVMLGYVTDIAYKASEVVLTLKVCFPKDSNEPGPGRAVCISRLLNLVPHHRQLEALYGIDRLSDELLCGILDPSLAWQRQWKRRRLRPVQPATGSAHSASLNLVQGGLNSSQTRFIEEVVCVSDVANRRESPQGHISHSGGFVLLQGPPGTGKTTTIVAALSALLASSFISKPPHSSSAGINLPVRQVRAGEFTLCVPVVPVRILVCAPSNTAVDEILLRVMERGLLTPSGSSVSPRVVRVGGGSKHEIVKSVAARELVDRAQRSIRSGRKNSSRDSGVGHCNELRAELRKTSAEIGTVDGMRRELRESHSRSLASRYSDDQTTPTKEDLMKVIAVFTSSEKELTEKLTSLHEKKRSLAAKLAVAEQNSKEEEKHRERERLQELVSVVNSASIVFATLNAAGHEALSYTATPFNAVIIDEAAQAIEPEVLIALVGPNTSLKKGVTQCFMVGDPRQLPATVLSTIQSVADPLSQSLFQRLQDAPRSRVHLLTKQYRMHPAISQFPSVQFYGGKLRNGAVVKGVMYRQPYHHDERNRFGPLTFVDTSRCREAFEQRSNGTSIYNPGEAEIVCAILLSAVRLYPEIGKGGKIAVLTPYRKQLSEIRRRIQSDGSLRQMEVEVNTVDGIQGREKEIVILSTVRSGRASSGIGFVKDERRLNVAITRARHAVIIVGNASLLSSSSIHWQRLLSHCRSTSCVLPFISIRDLFPEADPRRYVAPIVAEAETSLCTNVSSDSEEEGLMYSDGDSGSEESADVTEPCAKGEQKAKLLRGQAPAIGLLSRPDVSEDNLISLGYKGLNANGRKATISEPLLLPVGMKCDDSNLHRDVASKNRGTFVLARHSEDISREQLDSRLPTSGFHAARQIGQSQSNKRASLHFPEGFEPPTKRMAQEADLFRINVGLKPLERGDAGVKEASNGNCQGLAADCGKLSFAISTRTSSGESKMTEALCSPPLSINLAAPPPNHRGTVASRADAVDFRRAREAALLKSLQSSRPIPKGSVTKFSDTVNTPQAGRGLKASAQTLGSLRPVPSGNATPYECGANGNVSVNQSAKLGTSIPRSNGSKSREKSNPVLSSSSGRETQKRPQDPRDIYGSEGFSLMSASNALLATTQSLKRAAESDRTRTHH